MQDTLEVHRDTRWGSAAGTQLICSDVKKFKISLRPFEMTFEGGHAAERGGVNRMAVIFFGVVMLLWGGGEGEGGVTRMASDTLGNPRRD